MLIVWFVIGTYDTVAQQFFPDLHLPSVFELTYSRFPVFGWRLWVVIGLVLLLLAALEGAYRRKRAFDEQIRHNKKDFTTQITNLQQELDSIRNAIPNIECNVDVRTESLYVNRPGLGRVIEWAPLFARLLVRNHHTSVRDRVDAPDVAAHIEFQGDNGTAFPLMIGRWANTKHQSQGAMPSEVEQITLHPNGVPEPLLIALKHNDDELAYGLNVDNEKYDGWRDPNKSIPIGTWRVKVHLKGINVDKVFWLTLTNKGKGNDLEELVKGWCNRR